MTCTASVSGDSSAPRRTRRSSRHVKKPQIAFPHFREQDDLPCVHREVFDHRVDRLQDRYVVTLDTAMFEQSRRVNACEHAIRFTDSCPKLTQKLGLIHAGLRIELMLPVTHIRLSTHAADNPLSNVAIEVEDQIADAVGGLVGSPPDVLNRQSLDCLLDARHIAVGKELPGSIDERS
jgi:hypothetical protein